MCKVVNGSSPSYLANLLSQHVASRYLRSSEANLFVATVLFQNLFIEDLVFVDLYFEIICQLISNVLKLYLKLKHFELFL